MHPAKSVIFFTVISGLGLGLLNVAFLSFLGGHSISERIIVMLVLGLVFLTAGLLSSFLHLGHPERAWRAFSQWRSSWLSREGCLACLAYIVPLFWIGAYFNQTPIGFHVGIISAIIGLLINIATIHCTAMIYASLKPIPAWHNFFTPMNYQLLSAMSGFVVAAFLISLWGVRPPPMGAFILLAVSLAAIGKLHYWKFLRTRKPQFNVNQATGIVGNLSPFDPPHTSQNYLMKEMMFAWARHRQASLQRLVLLTAFLLPLLYGALSFWLSDFAYMVFGAIACAAMLVGLMIERWLFFACAEHSVSLYYGKAAV